MNKNIKRAKNIKIPVINYLPELPITDKKDEIIEAIKENKVVIIAGETGSGKTTQIPKFCIAAGRGVAGKIGCTQPRRIAAINVAARIAQELEESNSVNQNFKDNNNGIGDSSRAGQTDISEPLQAQQQFVGYKIRFDDTSALYTIIKVMTDGILLAETQRDPFLNEYDTIIVDEAHERSLNIDFTLGILRTLIKKRKNLKVIITSATIDTEKFSKAFDNAPIIEVSGRMYPVEVRYLPPQGYLEENQDNLLLSERYISQNQISDDSNYSSNQSNRAKYDPDQDDQSYVEAAVEAVESINRESRHGDILIFMPTEQDITETIELLRGRNWVGVTVLPLYARLSASEQAKIFHRGPGRKIIVSTNVAETSLTIPGIKYVIDTGLARIPHYSPRTRTTALPVTPISRSSADQRKGRCGRVENGICIRLYDEENYNSRALFTSPEILRSNLAEVILRMISLNLGDVSAFPFIDMPSPKSIKDGFDTLLELGAIELERKIPNSPLSEEVSEELGQGISQNRLEESYVNPQRAKSINRKSKSRRKSARGYKLTEKGRIMARIPVDPKLSRILIEANERGCLNEASIIASALSISDPRQRPQDKAQQADQKHAIFKDPASDFISLLNIWSSCYGEQGSAKGFENKKSGIQSTFKSRNSIRKFCKEHYLSFRRMREWSDIYSQIISVLNEHGISGKKSSKSEPFNPIVNKNAKTNSELKIEGSSNKFDIGGEFYTQLHKSILAGYLGNIANKKEKNIYHAAKGQKATIFPGSSIFNKAGNWIVAAEYVETSQLFARTAATIDVDWLEELGKSLCTYTWSSPHWEKKRGEVVAKEQVSLFGLVIVPERTVAYGKINPVEAGEIFIRHALVEGEIDMKFPFMEHNQKLIQELQDLEEKRRKRDILVTDEDIYLFYQKRLDRDFYNIRTFAKYLKDRTTDKTNKNRDRTDQFFLYMTLEDLRQKSVDDDHLSGFPDTIKIGNLNFYLDYNFEPGSETDGVTIKVPVVSLGHLFSSGDYDKLSYLDYANIASHPSNNKISSIIDWLVPGLFREKIVALIKNLPKSYRIKLLPVSEKADIIAQEIGDNRGYPLFYELSRFVKMRFNADIPPSVWSDQGIEPHLKMRLSIRDDEDREIASSRSLEALQEYVVDYTKSGSHSEDYLSTIKKRLEVENIRSWDCIKLSDWSEFGLSDPAFLPRSITFKQDDLSSYELFPALKVENRDCQNREAKLSLRLFKREDIATLSHVEGVKTLFIIFYENDMSALKKDIKSAARLKGYASFFGGVDKLNQALFNCITSYLFSSDIRTEVDFKAHAASNIPKLYSTGQELISNVIDICEEYKSAMDVLHNISLKNMSREPLIALMNDLKQNLEELVPPDFLQVYRYDRIFELKRYIAAIKIRGQRAVVDMLRDQKRWAEAQKYIQRIKSISQKSSSKLSESSSRIFITESCYSKEKLDAVDNLFWMVEEYKVSLFAQELKTAVKVSASRLDKLFEDIDRMI